MITAFFLIFILAILIAALPVWPHSKLFGYYPSGLTGVALIIAVVLVFRGVI